MAKKKTAPVEVTDSQSLPRMRQKYDLEVLPALKASLGRDNPYSLPKLNKIVVNMGVGEATQEKKFLEVAVDAMGQITGQKPLVTIARKAIANFRLREGSVLKSS